MKIGSLPKRAGPMRSLPLQLPAVGRNDIRPPHRGFAVGGCAFFAAWLFDQSNDWGGRQDGTTELALADSRVAGPAVWRGGYAAWASVPDHLFPAIPLISGGSKRFNGTIWSDFGRNALTWSSLVAVRGGTLQIRIAIRQTAIFDPVGLFGQLYGTSYIRSTV